ncbi:MAG: amidase family protein [Acidobacteriota bacterium]
MAQRVLALSSLLMIALVLVGGPAAATYSILGYDPQTGEVGGAVQSRVFAVGNGVLWAEAGVGVVATQAWVDVSYGPRGIELLSEGLSPAAVAERLLAEDPDPLPQDWPKAGRQFAVMDGRGAYVAHTGAQASDWAGHESGRFCTAQGNLLAGEAVPRAMVAAFESTTGSLAERLLAALEAGQVAGGDKRGMQSAALLVVRPEGGVWLNNDVVLRLQVDDDPEPLVELRRLVEKSVEWQRRATIAVPRAAMPRAAVPRAASQQAAAGAPGEWRLEETTIAQIHAAMRSGRLTARSLVQQYLDRIAAYDQQGPALNSLVSLNPKALERAEALDRELAESGQMSGPLHGIPVVVKDNYDTHDLPTTAGSSALAGSLPPDDATQVRKLRAAGAIVLAKSNMAEWAFSPYQTVGSALPGHTKNPYALDRVPAGSSGGTAAAIAANLGTVGLGTDTGNSIRGPSSHNLLVGVRSTMGLTSRDGIVPLYFDHDIGGPMARTVEDAARLLDVIAGYDPADPVTAKARNRYPIAYAALLDGEALQGQRMGVVRQLADRDEGDPEVRRRFEEALAVLRAEGAEIVDPVTISWLDQTPPDERWCPRFRWDLDRYLESLGEAAPFDSLAAIEASGKFHPSVASGIRYFLGIEGSPEENPTCRQAWAHGEALAAELRERFEEQRLDALIYPTWSNPPRRIGDLNTPHGDNSQDLSPHSGFPAVTVPMGLVQGSLPVGMTFLGDAWSEAKLLALAYAYEQATRHRRPPAATPPL